MEARPGRWSKPHRGCADHSALGTGPKKSGEDDGRIADVMEIYGKSMDIYGKSMEIYGKSMDIYGTS